jgi:hypothetical protein
LDAAETESFAAVVALVPGLVFVKVAAFGASVVLDRASAGGLVDDVIFVSSTVPLGLAAAGCDASVVAV